MSAKIRVYELARELNIDNKVAVAKLKAMGADVASHQSTVPADIAEKLKAELSGAAVAPTASAKAGASAGASNRVVIRRRKAEEAVPEEETPPVVVAPPVVEVKPVVAIKPVAAVAKPIVEEPLKVAAPVVAAPVEVKAPVVEVTPAPVEVSPALDVAVEPEEPVEAPVEIVAEARKRPIVSGGATILRRASPEEIEQSRIRQAKAAEALNSRTSRKEDSRGTRVTGLGLLKDRSAGGQGAPSVPGIPGTSGIAADGSVEAEWSDRRRLEEKGRKTKAEEEEAAKPKSTKQKRASATLSMRALLSQAEDPSEPEEIEGAPVAEVVQARTVYTPSAPRGRREAKRRKDLKKTQVTTPRASYRVVKMGANITVGELAHQMAVKAVDIIKKLMMQGTMVTINADLDVDTATLLAQDYGFELESIVQTIDDVLGSPAFDPEMAITRAPIVTIMGHVDHGKTSILDAIRETDVASGEAGGITQHIGAYQVVKNGRKITFLDTPGHEAFSAMRARGASLTDIVVLVVAADDGVMPQTREAIAHAKEANVPLIVAINKIDKPNKNLDRIYSELTEHGVQSEEWGGDVQFVKTSALQKLGIQELLDAILVQADILELTASPEGRANGTVVEAHLDRGRGPVATVMVTYGTLRVGDFIAAGSKYGRVRAMQDHHGKIVLEAGPSTPVEIIGLNGVPGAGDRVDSVPDEKTAREAAEWRIDQARGTGIVKSSAATLEDLLGKIQTADKLEVPLIIKADTQGSVEAIAEAITKIDSDKVKARIIYRAAGGISESDVTLAKTSGALVVGFNVRAQRGLDESAERDGVPVKYFSIIYELIDAVKAVMAGSLPPVVKEVVLGHAEVRQSISVPRIGTIAGSSVVDGKITRNSQLRLIRDSVVIYSGKIGSLRRFKDDVREVATGYECGIGIDGYNDIRIGDVIESYMLEESAATL